MINHIYIDNYKCFVNFECKPQALQLLLGDNGSGKTALFDVLETLRDFVCEGKQASVAFLDETLTAWDTRSEQTFELGIEGNGGQYFYRLVINYDQWRGGIRTEKVTFDGASLYTLDGSEEAFTAFYSDSKSLVKIPFPAGRSAIEYVAEYPGMDKLSWFRDHLAKLRLFAPDPLRTDPRSEAELEVPDRPLHQLTSWLRHLSQDSVDALVRLRDDLSDGVIQGLKNIKLEKHSDIARLLKFEFEVADKASGKPFSLNLDQLSTGQRNLVAIYTILHGAINTNATVCIDEPDNFVSLRELQPWVIALRDRVEDTKGQCFLVSHNPELINYLAPAHGLFFYREENGPARVKAFEWKGDEEGGYTPAELVARGWLDNG